MNQFSKIYTAGTSYDDRHWYDISNEIKVLTDSLQEMIQYNSNNKI